MISKFMSVHYNEIALKGKNRPHFEKILYNNLERATNKKIERRSGRLILKNATEQDMEAALITPGVAWAGESIIIPRDIMLLKNEIKNIGADRGVEYDVKRVDKQFGQTSLEIKSLLQKEAGVTPLKGGFKIRVEIMKDSFIVSYNIKKGIGGLPIGSAGKILSLFSGGIDSSVVPFEMMKRGSNVDLLHVYAFSQDTPVMESKIKEITSLIGRLEKVTLYTAPFYIFSAKAAEINPRYELVLFKRFLLLLAEKLALERGHKAIATGDSLSQVASQTLDNINAISYGINLPVFRPLIGYNKDEIIEKAKFYGTYDISIKKYKDCCSIVSKKPATAATPEKVKELEKMINMTEIVESTLKETTSRLI